MEKECAVCGKVFITERTNAKYCCKKCRDHSRFDMTLAQKREKMVIDARIVVDLYDSDYSTEEIAEKVGRQKTFVYNAWRDAGLPKRLTTLQKQVFSLRNEGRSCVEIANILGKETKNISRISKDIGKPFTEDEKRLSIAKGKEKAIEKQYGTVEERKQKQIDFFAKYHPDFEYVSGWLSSDGMMKIKCKACGTVIEKSAITIRRKNRIIQCPVCEKQKIIDRDRERTADLERKRRQKEEEKKFAIFNKEFQQMAFKQCKCCGSLFLGKNRCYCSAKCANKVFNSIGKDKRIKKKKAVIIDRGITLEKLYEKDNGICWLCGCQCDWEDYKITPDGAFVVGKNYPSEDHVVPLSKGGKHSWDNVKLAHHYCNTLKGDKVVSL